MPSATPFGGGGGGFGAPQQQQQVRPPLLRNCRVIPASRLTPTLLLPDHCSSIGLRVWDSAGTLAAVKGC